jgi:dTDP-glucose 4,6-dehydratase
MDANRILVTGAAGFVGNAFLRHVLANEPDARVMTFDALTYAGHRVNLEDLPDPDRHAFVEGDIADADAVAAAMDSFRPDAVVNFAAETHVDRSILDPAPFVRTNVIGTQVLIDATRAAGVRLLHVSTDEVYGDVPEPDSATPESPLAPTNTYSASKAAGDLLVQAAWRSHRQDVVITRSTNNYGPRQTPEKLVPLMILRAQANESLPVYGDGAQVRDWLHVEDNAAGVWAALRQGRAGALYHFAGRQPRTNLQVVHAILGVLDAPASLIAHVRDRPGHDRRYALDDAQTVRELDWSPRIPLERGLPDTVRWYREHEAWCRKTAGEDLRAFLDANYAGRDGPGS